MADIVLATLNAKYVHTAFGLRYLFANLGELKSKAVIVESDINKRTLEIAEAILEHDPRVVGLGVYIWNVAQTTELVAVLKRLRPDLVVVLGGPEVSYETESQRIVELADVVVTGEADAAFGQLCSELLAAGRAAPRAGNLPKVMAAQTPDLAQIALPYEHYTAEDVAHRIVYVETSRGCPFGCEFCLSSLDRRVRYFPLEPFFQELDRLIERGATRFKFVDRTFNLELERSLKLLRFLRERCRPGQMFHFEIVPDRLQDEFLEFVAQFPPEVLRFEVGVQTFNPQVAMRINRFQNYQRLKRNLRFLREQTGVLLHADLVFGLPGETLDSFADGFDELVALRPHEIQLGILKRLRGAPISRHDVEWQMVYNPNPPYEILQSKTVSFDTVQRVRRFARFWELIWNSGNFGRTAPMIWARASSPFRAFMRWSDWLFARVRRTDSIALVSLMELLFEYLTVELGLDPAGVAAALAEDYQRAGRRELPAFLKRHLRGVRTAAAPRVASQ
ncbi:MAG: B12-binding domain-containing radical SAM protein [Verrucomicrobiae bacterium]|nr:B12-binding domain-containing radical SAM protein [Verrucomicrobiae bacterium]MDW7979658.1 DUF4080 domain-containing protein [Verrucomicrobiales bacterium]